LECARADNRMKLYISPGTKIKMREKTVSERISKRVQNISIKLSQRDEQRVK
jgi:hypothetical protein